MKPLLSVALVLLPGAPVFGAYDPKPDLLRVASVTDTLEIRWLPQPLRAGGESPMELFELHDKEKIQSFIGKLAFVPEEIRGEKTGDGSYIITLGCDCPTIYHIVLRSGDIDLLVLQVKPDGGIKSESIRHGTDLAITPDCGRHIVQFISTYESKARKANQRLQGTPESVPSSSTEPETRRP